MNRRDFLRMGGAGLALLGLLGVGACGGGGHLRDVALVMGLTPLRRLRSGKT